MGRLVGFCTLMDSTLGEGSGMKLSNWLTKSRRERAIDWSVIIGHLVFVTQKLSLRRL